MKELFKGWQQRMRALHLHSDIMASANFLNQLVQQNFYSILTGLQVVRETGIKNVDTNYEKEFQAINSLYKMFSRMDETKVTYMNGFHVNQATTSLSRISLDETTHKPDYVNFFLATLPVIDEQSLNPNEFNIVRGMFTAEAAHLRAYRRLRPHTGYLPQRDFSYLDYSMLNLNQSVRKYIMANITESEAQAL